MLISVHIPKCAGTSFRHTLHSLYGDGLWLNYGEIFTRADAASRSVPPNTTCVHGHFFADAFDAICPGQTIVTWVRHPVERVVSNYYHFLRNPDSRDACCRALWARRLSLREFAELEWMRNEATRYCAGKAVEEFAFVGISERFDESLCRFSETFGLRGNRVSLRDNVNPLRTTLRYPISDSDYTHLLELNAEDLSWYETAVQALDLPLVEAEPVFAA